MLRMFQKDRNALLSAKKIRKYLVYAVGEIVLVVIGILIALQFNNADLDRQDRKKEKELMVSLLADLEHDVAEIDAAVAGNRSLLDGLDALLREIAQQPQNMEDERAIFRDSIRNTYWYLTAEFTEGTMSQLKYSGGLQLISGKNVVDGILAYDQGMARCKHQYDEMMNYFHAVEATQKVLFDLSLGKRVYEFIEQDFMNMLLPAEQFDAFIDEGDYLVDSDPKTLQKYYGDVLYFRTTINNLNAFLSKQKVLAGSLSTLISNSYDIQ